MSFGGSPGDIIIVIQLAALLVRRCKAAGGEYAEISREVASLHTVLRHLKHEVDAPDSLLNRDKSKYGSQLIPIIGNCDHTLQRLEELLRKHGRLAEDRPGIWDRLRFANSDIDSLNDLRMKLNSHKTTITVFLDTVQLKHASYVSKTLGDHGGQLDVLLDKVDRIAERMGQRANSLMTSYGEDDKEVWKEFRRELIAEGFSSDVLQRNKDVLRAYIREIDQKGLLTETPITPVSPAPVSLEWLDSVKADEPRSPEAERIRPSEGTKELVVHEENMKFPQSMKGERAKPVSQNTARDVQHGLSALGIDTKEVNESKESNTDLGSDNLTSDESDTTSKQSQVLIVRTSDLGHRSNVSTNENNLLRAPQPRRPPHLYLESQLNLRSESGSPTSINGQISDRSRTHSAPLDRQRTPDPSQPRGYISRSPGRTSESVAIPIRQRRIAKDHSQSPQPSSLPLAPDARGNAIPPDAKWTKIKRSLVSLEILDQDGHRYEARPEFVAVLGVLSHQEIKELASRSKIVREARRQRSREPPRQPSPRKAPRNFRYSRQKAGYHTPSDDDDSSSSSEHEEQHRPDHKDRRRRTQRNFVNKESSYQTAPYTPPQGMWSPNSPPPPPTSYQSSIQGPPYSYPPQNTSHSIATSPQPNIQPVFYYPPPQPYLSANPPIDDRSHKGRRRGESHQSHRKDAKKSTTSRWRENLIGVGIGGAAGSLLSVLSEAAAEL